MPSNSEKPIINLTVNGEVTQPIEIVYREGNANDLPEPKKFHLQNMTLGGIANYLGGIENPPNGIAYYNLEKRIISFFENKNDKDSTYLEEQLKLSKHFEAFRINTGHTFNSELFQKLVLGHAIVLESKEYAKSLLASLRNFEVVYRHEQKKADDRQGNTENTSKRSLEIASGNIPQEIKLKGNLFEGVDHPSDILLTVEIDIVNDKPAFSFYSFEYDEIVQTLSEELILSEVDTISEHVTCLQVQ